MKRLELEMKRLGHVHTKHCDRLPIRVVVTKAASIITGLTVKRREHMSGDELLHRRSLKDHITTLVSRALLIDMGHKRVQDWQTTPG